MTDPSTGKPAPAKAARLNPLRARLSKSPDLVFIGLCALTPVLSYLGNLSFSPLIALAGVATLFWFPRIRAGWALFALLTALTAWALASQLWSPYVPPFGELKGVKAFQSLTGVKMIFELALYPAAVGGSLALSEGASRRGLDVLSFGAVLLVVFLMIEAADGEALYSLVRAAEHQDFRPDIARRNVARACYELALFTPFICLHLWQKAGRARALAVLFPPAVIGVSWALQVDSPIVAVVVAGLVALTLKVGKRFGSYALIAASTAYFMSAPLIAGSKIAEHFASPSSASIAKASWGARLQIWRFTAGLIHQNPIRGWGLDTSRVFTTEIPLHPHNAALQLWLELGAPGAAFGALIFAWIFAAVETLRARDPALGAAAAGVTSAYLVIGGLSFGVWQEWWIGLAALAFILANGLATARRNLPPPSEGLIPLELV